MVPLDEELAHGGDVVGVEGEMLVGVVAGAAHALDLLDDRGAVFAAPFVAGLDELLAANLKTADTLFGQFLVDLGLRGDAGVVGAQDPAGLIPLHAGTADAGVLDGVVERMAHVEHAGDVGRRDDDRVAIVLMLAETRRALEIPAIVPRFEQRRLMGGEVVVHFLLIGHTCAPFRIHIPLGFLATYRAIIRQRKAPAT